MRRLPYAFSQSRSGASRGSLTTAIACKVIKWIDSSAIEQKCGTVDQGPGDVLRRRQTPHCSLLNAHFQVGRKLDESRIRFDGPGKRIRAGHGVPSEMGSAGRGVLLASNGRSFPTQLWVNSA